MLCIAATDVLGPASTASSDDWASVRAAYRLLTATSLRFAGQALLPNHTLAGSTSKQAAEP
jgi:hypothetical protein